MMLLLLHILLLHLAKIIRIHSQISISGTDAGTTASCIDAGRQIIDHIIVKVMEGYVTVITQLKDMN